MCCHVITLFPRIPLSINTWYKHAQKKQLGREQAHKIIKELAHERQGTGERKQVVSGNALDHLQSG